MIIFMAFNNVRSGRFYNKLFSNYLKSQGYYVKDVTMNVKPYGYERDMLFQSYELYKQYGDKATYIGEIFNIAPAMYSCPFILLPHVAIHDYIRHRLRNYWDIIMGDSSIAKFIEMIEAYTKMLKYCTKKRLVSLVYHDHLLDMYKKYFGTVILTAYPFDEYLKTRMIPKVGGNVEYDVVIVTEYFKVGTKLLKHVLDNLVGMKLKVALILSDSSKTLTQIAKKLNVKVLHSPEDQEYFETIIKSKIMLDINVEENLGVKYLESIYLGTPVFSIHEIFGESIKIEEVRDIVTSDLDEILVKQKNY